MAEMEVTSSRGKEGIISAIWVNWSRALRARASISRPSSTVSGASSMLRLEIGLDAG